MALQARTGSASTPLLQAAKTALYYYDPDYDRDYLSDALGISRYAGSVAVRKDLVALYIVQVWSMRVSEYLDAKIGDVLPYDQVLIRGKKGSASYRICLPGITAQIMATTNLKPGMNVAGTTYANIYRLCVQSRYGALQPGHINVSRTHKSRFDLAGKFHAENDRTAGDLLHHRSPDTVSYYNGAKGGSHGCHKVRYTVKGKR